MLQWFFYLLVMGVAIAQPKTKIPCGLPPFVTKLPPRQAAQLKEAWANYRNGSTCENEQKMTFEIVGTLSEAERAAVFNDEPQEIGVEDQFDTTPRFIRLLSPEVKKGFDAIWTDNEPNTNVKHKKLMEYAKQKFNEEQMKGFNVWMSDIVKAQREMDERVKRLSPKAKELYERMMKMREDQVKLLRSITPELSKELYGLI